MDPRRIQFAMSKPRPLLDDDDNRGLNCEGCLFHKQPARVCMEAAEQALQRGLRDCDAVDQFGEVVVYERVGIDPRQLDLLQEEPNADQES